ncbi:MAG: hypothetical protein Athens071426_350 [Parcubacteria group bacterium Athens0714_26]|nr:MAG: hypothetical protein Athens071426_350 [Parcubacteria group bacterium Athens0714_26]
MNISLAKIINRMAVRDQEMRKKAAKSGIWDLKIDQINTENMKKIIKENGWPTISLAGKKASRNAWLLAQHADCDKDFQKKCLSLMLIVFRNNPNDIAKENIAYLKDRILINEGKKQLFGTQFITNKQNNKLTPRPIKDIKNLEKRRKEYNLPLFLDYLEMAKSHNSKQIKNIG